MSLLSGTNRFSYIIFVPPCVPPCVPPTLFFAHFRTLPIPIKPAQSWPSDQKAFKHPLKQRGYQRQNKRRHPINKGMSHLNTPIQIHTKNIVKHYKNALLMLFYHTDQTHTHQTQKKGRTAPNIPYLSHFSPKKHHYFAPIELKCNLFPLNTVQKSPEM